MIEKPELSEIEEAEKKYLIQVDDLREEAHRLFQVEQNHRRQNLDYDGLRWYLKDFKKMMKTRRKKKIIETKRAKFSMSPADFFTEEKMEESDESGRKEEVGEVEEDRSKKIFVPLEKMSGLG